MKNQLKSILLFSALFGMLLLSGCKDDVAPSPTITGFTPTNGVATATGTGATGVTITGTNFSATPSSNIVKFNGTEAVVTASTTTSITTSVPSTATTGTITVTVGGQTATSTATFRVDLLFKATMNGASQPTPNTSTATGAATLTFNLDTKIYTVVVTYTGLTPTAGHIHKGAVGVAGSIVYPFATPISSPINFTSPALTLAQEADLNGGLNYVNLHTTAFPGGEIRGQLLKQ